MENLKAQNPQLTQGLVSLHKMARQLRILHYSWQEMNREGIPEWRGRMPSSTAAHTR